MVKLCAGVLLATICFFSCTPSPSDTFLHAEQPPEKTPAPGTTFERIPTDQSGIRFVPDLQESFQYNFLLDPYEYNGGGVAVLDIDNDGLQDLFFTHRFNGCRLYRNKGNFQFEDISERSGVSKPSGLKTGVAVVDINTDGYPDLYVCRTWLSNVPERRNLLFVNNHDGTFSEQAAAYGIDDPSPSQCANFFDYDLDGDLDLYVVNHPVDFRTMNNLDYQPTTAAPLARSQGPKDEFESDKLFRNNGKGHFDDVSQKAGIHNRAYGLSATTADVNADGRPDIFVANDFVMPDFLYLNNHDGTFREAAQQWFSHSATHSMGCDIGDLNNDGYPDLCVPDMLGSTLQRRKELLNTMFLERSKMLVRQGYGPQQMRNVLHVYNPSPSPQGEGVFSEVGCLAGMEATEWSWAPLLADFDNDGWKDLFITAGVYRDLNDQDFFFYTADSLQKTGGVNSGRFKNFEEVAGKLSRYPVHNFMFQNTGSLQLSEVSEAWGLGEKGFSNGAAYADLDNDGDLDLIVNKFNEPAALFANQAVQKSANHWLQIRCKGGPGNPTGTGAKIRVYAGGQLFYQEMTPIRGFYSSVEPVFQVGLGKAAQAERLEIEWPEGKFQVLEGVPANQRLTLDIARAQSGRLPRPAPPRPWMSPAPQLPAFVHRENDFEDFDRERLLLHRFSRSGPCLAVADVNGDGRSDVFAGGAAGQAGALFLQQSDGSFRQQPQAGFEADAGAEDSGAVFFDADADGDPDLYVVSGGNEAAPGAAQYQDRLYLNEGQGAFRRSTEGLPRETASGQAVCAFDYDGDRDLDLFVGGRVSPGQFPSPPRSLLLTNDGKGRFALSAAGILDTVGMVTGALAADLNGDGRSELVLCGEWMPLRVLAFAGGQWTDQSEQYGLSDTHGLWNCLLAADLDGDGDLDLVAGNEGLNTRLKASPGAPLRLFALDFDLNQSLDPVVAIADKGRYYPLAQRNELANQMPNLIKSKFIRYRSYARAALEEVLDLKKLRAARQLRVERLESTWFENRDGRLVAHALPLEAQISCTKTIVIQDFTKDGKPDLLLLGNDTNNTPETGPYDASRGVLLENKGAGGWSAVPNRIHGCWALGEIRSSAVLPLAGGRQLILAGSNNGPLQGWIF